jgi:hypothetical protein
MRSHVQHRPVESELCPPEYLSYRPCVALFVVLIVVRRGTEILQSLGFGSRVLRLSHETARDFNPDMQITKLEWENSVGWQSIDWHDPGAEQRVSVRLVDHEQGTRLRFWQHFARELENDHCGTYTSTEALTSKACD